MDTYVTIGEHKLTYHYYLKPLLMLGFTLGLVHFMGLDLLIMTCFYHCNYRTESFHCPKNPLIILLPSQCFLKVGIGMELIFEVVLVSGTQQSESVTRVDIPAHL